jgi:hypothetical protein
MVPAGYTLKRVAMRPEWLDAPHVQRICSASTCISKDFAEFTPFWRHNDFWLFDSPAAIRRLVAEHHIEVAGTQLFYFEAYELERLFNGDTAAGDWAPLKLSGAFPPNVEPPQGPTRLLGYDVVTWGDVLECSPLSCNGMASELPTNANCLFDTLEAARTAIDENRFHGCEPGIYRILAVHEVVQAGSA